MFYNQFMPGGTGGDIVKTYLLWKETPGKKPGALLAVLFDRMIGLMALIIDYRCADLRRAMNGSRKRPRPRACCCACSWLFSAARCLCWQPHSSSPASISWTNSAPTFSRPRKVDRRSAAYHLYARHWRATLVAFGMSLVAHLGTFITFLCVAYAFMRSAYTPPRRHRFLRHHADRAHDFLAADQLWRRGLARIVLQIMPAQPGWRCRQAAAQTDRFAQLSRSSCSAACRAGIVYFFYKPSGATGPREDERDAGGIRHPRA